MSRVERPTGPALHFRKSRKNVPRPIQPAVPRGNLLSHLGDEGQQRLHRQLGGSHDERLAAALERALQLLQTRVTKCNDPQSQHSMWRKPTLSTLKHSSCTRTSGLPLPQSTSKLPQSTSSSPFWSPLGSLAGEARPCPAAAAGGQVEGHSERRAGGCRQQMADAFAVRMPARSAPTKPQLHDHCGHQCSAAATQRTCTTALSEPSEKSGSWPLSVRRR